MELSFQKLSSYESIMDDLREQNEQLQQNVFEKEQAIEEHSKEIDHKQ